MKKSRVDELERIYYKRKESRIKPIILIDSLKVTLIVTAVIVLCSMMGDAVSQPIQVYAGMTAQQIKDSQNVTLLLHTLAIPLMMLGTYIASVAMLSYLQHGE